MRITLIFLILSFISSCINVDELDMNKYDDLVLTPTLLLPFIQINLSSDYYEEIYEDQSSTKLEIDMAVNLFKDHDFTDNVTEIEFNFNTINGFPISFDTIAMYFIDENGVVLESLVLDNIDAGIVNSDGSLKYESTKKYNFVYDISSITLISNTRSIKVIMSWDGNSKPYTEPHSSFYFKTYSDLILKTKI